MDVATAQAHLDAWLAADLAVSANQSYSIDNRALTRADAETIRQQIAYWTRMVNTLTSQAASAADTFAANNPGVARASFS